MGLNYFSFSCNFLLQCCYYYVYSIVLVITIFVTMLLLYVYSIVLVVTICYNVVTICLFNSFSCNYLLQCCYYMFIQ